MFYSRLSGKFKVFVDGEFIIDTYRFGKLENDIDLEIEGKIVTIRDNGEFPPNLNFKFFDFFDSKV